MPIDPRSSRVAPLPDDVAGQGAGTAQSTSRKAKGEKLSNFLQRLNPTNRLVQTFQKQIGKQANKAKNAFQRRFAGSTALEDMPPRPRFPAPTRTPPSSTASASEHSGNRVSAQNSDQAGHSTPVKAADNQEVTQQAQPPRSSVPPPTRKPPRMSEAASSHEPNMGDAVLYYSEDINKKRPARKNSKPPSRPASRTPSPASSPELKRTSTEPPKRPPPPVPQQGGVLRSGVSDAEENVNPFAAIYASYTSAEEPAAASLKRKRTSSSEPPKRPPPPALQQGSVSSRQEERSDHGEELVFTPEQLEKATVTQLPSYGPPTREAPKRPSKPGLPQLSDVEKDTQKLRENTLNLTSQGFNATVLQGLKRESLAGVVGRMFKDTAWSLNSEQIANPKFQQKVRTRLKNLQSGEHKFSKADLNKLLQNHPVEFANYLAFDHYNVSNLSKLV